MTNFHSYRLDNGVRVLVDVIPHVRTAHVQYMFKVGARAEAPEVSGVCHFLEHMSFRGTRSRSTAAITNTVRDIGAHHNAETTMDDQVFHVTGLAEDEFTMHAHLSDIAQYAVLEPGAIEAERGIITAEIKGYREKPDFVCISNARQAAFQNCSLGRAVLGTEQTVSRIAIKDLEDFSRRHQNGNNLIVSVAGNVNPVATLDAVKRFTNNMKPGTEYTGQLATFSEATCHEIRPTTLMQLAVIFNSKGAGHPAYASERILADIIAGSDGSRLWEAFRSKSGQLYNLFCGREVYDDIGLFKIHLQNDPDSLESVVSTLTSELRAIVKHGVTEDEVERSRKAMVVATAEYEESGFARMQTHANNMRTYGRDVSLSERLNHLSAVTPESVQQQAERIFSDECVVSTVSNAEDIPLAHTALKQQLAL